MVLSGVLELFLLLLNSLLDLGTDLGNLDLSAENLALFSFKGGLSLVQSVLEFLLLDFQTADDLLHLVNRASSFSELVGEILDFLAQALVLTTESLNNLSEFLLGVLGLEEVGGGVAEITLSSIEFSGQVVGLLSPFVDDLVEALLLLLKSGGDSVGSLDINLSVIQISNKSGFGLLKGSDLGVGGIKSLLELVDLLGLTSLGILEFISLKESFSLEASLPLLDIGIGLGELSEDLVLSFDLLFERLLKLLSFVLVVLGLSSNGLTFACLLIGGTASLLELRGELRLQSGELADLRFGILELTNEVSVLGVKTSLERSEVLELTRLLISLRLKLGELELELLGELLVVELGRCFLVELSSEILSVMDGLSLVLLNLSLGLVELVKLVGEFSDGVSVLLAESSELVLVVHVGLFQISAELGEFSLTLLVDLNLGGGGSSLLVEFFTELFQLALEIGLGAVSLGALLLLQVVLQIVTLTSRFVDVLLSNLELSLDLSLLLVEISTSSLLTLKGILEVIKSLLKLGLDLVLVVTLVLFGLEVLHELAVDLLLVLLLLVELGNSLILLLHFVLERSDLVVLGLLLGLSLAERHLQILDLLLQSLDLGLNLLLGALNISGTVFVIGELVVELGELLGGVFLLRLKLCKSLFGIGELGLGGFQVGEEGSLLLDELGRGLLQFLAEFLFLGQGLLKSLNLVVDFLELLGFLSGLEHWLDLSVKLEPFPGTECAPGADVALDDEKSGTLLHTTLAFLESQVPSDLGLESSEDGGKFLVTDVFEMSKNSGLEEDLGETDTEHFLVEGSVVDEFGHDGLSTLLLVVIGLGLLGGKDSVTLDEVWMEGSVGESLSANSDSFQHSVASKLVENQSGVDHSALFLLVWNDATDEMWVSLVEHSHQVVEGLSVEHRDSHERSRLSLLLSTATSFLGLSGSLFLSGVVLPDLDKKVVELGSLHGRDNGVVEWILVLLKPVHAVVTDSSGVVPHGEVSFSLLSLWWLWLLEVWMLSKMLVDKLGGKSQVSSLWYDTLFIEHGDDTEWLKDNKYNMFSLL
ncbi:hypothetical protein GCK72_001456 [Caenorhabditis remanei]|uniref:Uncharacterized protein n=1 Tax=Caenorhabditis remanei TaxID=31234 RepID=A0A6A5HPM4_CAERE|nr:hypothetical protein GCK72_001456 [Caenorhabditis remanei]KAF1769639.1 hypothetical protein GCK72_001456 [Caenorhabditis remanei]